MNVERFWQENKNIWFCSKIGCYIYTLESKNWVLSIKLNWILRYSNRLLVVQLHRWERVEREAPPSLSRHLESRWGVSVAGGSVHLYDGLVLFSLRRWCPCSFSSFQFSSLPLSQICFGSTTLKLWNQALQASSNFFFPFLWSTTLGGFPWWNLSAALLRIPMLLVKWRCTEQRLRSSYRHFCQVPWWFPTAFASFVSLWWFSVLINVGWLRLGFDFVWIGWLWGFLV